jgi:nucleoid DNA-binding protein
MALDHKDISGLLHEFFIQNGSLSLPGIGVFRLMRISAQVDFANRRMIPPSYTVRYDHRGEAPTKDLFGYLSMKTGTDDLEAVRLLNHFAFDMKDRLQHGQDVELVGLGRLLPDRGSGFGFEPNRMTFDFTSEVEARRVVHKDAELTLVVGDEEKTSAEMQEILTEWKEKPGLMSRFWFRALFVAVTALLIIASRFLFTPTSVMPDRADTLQPGQPAPGYSIQKQP